MKLDPNSCGVVSVVLPLVGQFPSHVMVVVFPDGVLVIYGEDCGGFFRVDKGNCCRFGFDKYPILREMVVDGVINLAKVAGFVAMERRL